jgi:DNA-binding transcriptional regulator YhcF (GntR family)
MYQKELEFIEKSEKPLSTKEIADLAKQNLFLTRQNLTRLAEEGKIESLQKDGVVCWKVKTKDEKEEKMEKRVR